MTFESETNMKPDIGHEVPDPIPRLYRRLKEDPACTGEDREAAKVAFLAGEASEWHRHALENIPDWTESQRTRLCEKIVATGRDSTMIWTLKDVALTPIQHEKLVQGIIALRDPSSARLALRDIKDLLSSDEHSRLLEISKKA